MTMNTRHRATQTTLNHTISSLRKRNLDLESAVSTLQTAVDQLGGDLAKAKWGRRKEVRGRLVALGREEWVVSQLRAVVLSLQEGSERVEDSETLVEERDQVLVALEEILDALNATPPHLHELQSVRVGDVEPSSLGRVILAEAAVERLSEELRVLEERLDEKDQSKLVGDEERGVDAEKDGSLGQSSPVPSSSPALPEDPSTPSTPKVGEPEESTEAIDSEGYPEAEIASDGREKSEDLPPKEPEHEVHINVVDKSDGAIEDVATEGLAEPTTMTSAASPSSTVQSLSTSGYASPASEFPEPSPPPPHPLLIALSTITHRYDDLQHSFRDCYLTLIELRRTLSDPSPAQSDESLGTSKFVLQTAVERLYDYTEDARVELEIRAADEELAVKGWEAIIRMGDEESSSLDIPAIESFVEGSDPAIQKALGSFSVKLADIEHDIARIQAALDNPVPFAADPPLIVGQEEDVPQPETKSTSWSSWTSGLLGVASGGGSSNQPPPTFGSVITTPRGLRHSSSMTFSRKSSTSRSPTRPDPFKTLGLKVPMPSYEPPASHPQKDKSLGPKYIFGTGPRGRPSGFPPNSAPLSGRSFSGPPSLSSVRGVKSASVLPTSSLRWGLGEDNDERSSVHDDVE